MPVKRRSTPRLLVVALAVPVVVLVYLAVAGRRSARLGRDVVAAFLAVTVIGSIYAEVAARAAVTPARRQPLPLTVAMALVLAVIGSGLPSAPTHAANADGESVIAVALNHLGAKYVIGTEGPTTFDCSGLVYYAFMKADQLPLIGGRRMRAAGYYTYFSTRGMSSKTTGHRGDLVAYGKDGVIRHIGIYLGDGKVVSALEEGVKVHGIDALVENKFVAFLNVPWGTTVTDTSTDTSDQMTTSTFVSNVPQGADQPQSAGDGNNQGDEQTPASDVIAQGYAFGSMNVRENAGSAEAIVSWVTRGQTVDILASTKTSGGALWYNIRKPSGKEGWVWSGWMKVVSGSVDGG
jgi:cell wall-associated NlpC family hydrolase